jgi:ABC-type multidrug transport system fused ATPase/permease subunit
VVPLIPFRIKIGVTGHRENLPEEDLLKEKIRSVIGFREWDTDRSIKPNSIFSLFSNVEELKHISNTPIAYSVLTAIAEGADRIVAKTVLEIENSTIEVVLPLSKEDYLQDFKTSESKLEFEKLLGLDYNPVRLRNQNLNDQYASEDIHEKRNQSYLNAGKYIVDRCDVLLAIWDGEPARGRGGTAEIVNYARENDRPIIIISTTNINDLTVINNIGLNVGVIKQINFFNTFNLNSENEVELINNSYEEYFSEENIREFKDIEIDSTVFVKFNLLPFYVKASVISEKYKNQYKKSGVGTYIVSTLAIIILSTTVVFNLNYQLAFGVELFILVTILIVIYLGHKKRIHKNWLEHRFLTERFRAAAYLFITGQEVTEIKISNYHEKSYESGQWAIRVFSEIWNQLKRKWYFQNIKHPTYSAYNNDLVEYIKKSWIIGQISYHENFCRRNKWWNKFLETGGKWIFFTAIVAAFIHIVISFQIYKSQFLEIMEKLLTVLALLLPPVAAAFEGIRRHREYSRNIQRSESMIVALSELLKKYNAVDNESNFYELTKETDKLMLQESQHWIMLMIPSELEYVT